MYLKRLGMGLFVLVGCAGGLLVSFTASVSAQQNSNLWGENGERWDPLGRLPDYSYAGYHSGEDEIPRVSVATDVTDFGAIPNDDRDDSAAIQAAIDATSSGAVLIPKGSFRLDKPITIRNSGIVIRGVGDGPGETELYVPQNATERNGGNHEMAFSWGSAGFIVLFQGNSPTGSITIERDAKRGDRSLFVSDTTGLRSGGELVIRMRDDSLYGSLFQHLHNNRLNGWSEGTPGTWCGADGSWPFTIESIDGSQVTIKEPLPFDILSKWSPTAQQGRAIFENGIENLRIRFRYSTPVKHLTERGFNAIRFERVRDSWIRNVTVEDVDNGITIGKQSSRNSLLDIVVDGRRGHHATTISGGSSYNLITGIELKVDAADDEWIHAFTIDHAAQGNVVQRAESNKNLRLDLHRDSPFENLYTEILTESNFKSGGNKCAGPHTGARLTLWNAAGVFSGVEEYLLKGIDSQVNIITRTDRPDVSSENGLWVENFDNVQPTNLYTAQLERRLGNSGPDVKVGLISVTGREENGVVNVTARLSAVSNSDVSIDVHTKPDSAINGEDFFGFSRPVTIPAGSLEVTIPVSLINDSSREQEERFELRIFSATGAEIEKSIAVVSIIDDDEFVQPELSIEDGQATEGEAYSIRLTLSEAATQPVGVSIATQADSAINGQDYFGLYETVEFATGETDLEIPVAILDDTEKEATETFTQTIFSTDGARVKRGQASTIIIDND